MNAMGWQIGATLIGISTLIIAIYVAKLLNTTNKVIDKANRIVDYNERNINETIDNVTVISKDIKDILSVVTSISGIFNVFKMFKK